MGFFEYILKASLSKVGIKVFESSLFVTREPRYENIAED